IGADGGYTFSPALNYAGPVPAVSYTVSDGFATDTSTLSIRVKSAAEQAADLQAKVSALQKAGVLSHGQANSLIVKLNLKGNNGDVGKVQAFLQEVDDLLAADILTKAQAKTLRDLGNILLLSVTLR